MEREIRVLQLAGGAGIYGAERWILALIRNLPAVGVSPHVGVIKDEAGGEPEMCLQAARLGARTTVFEAPGRISWPAISQLERYLTANRIDVVHTHGYKTDIIGALAARRANTSILSTPHGSSAAEGFRLKVYEAIGRFSWHLHDAVVPLSSELYEGLKDQPSLRPKLHLILNGVDLAEVDSARGRSSELMERKRRGEFIVGYVGRLVAPKRVETLIRAVALMETRLKHLCIIGEGPEETDLRRVADDAGVADQVEFFGYRADRLDILKCFDVFVLPSASEGIPRCVLEAMAAGVPVIATDIPGCRSVLEHGVTGLTFAVGEATDLRMCLEMMMSDVHLRQSLSRSASQFVRREFSAQAMAIKYAELYRYLLAAGAQSGVNAVRRSV
jgi:glycosyltransferase involved in cell wall biosynthesis